MAGNHPHSSNKLRFEPRVSLTTQYDVLVWSVEHF